MTERRALHPRREFLGWAARSALAASVVSCARRAPVTAPTQGVRATLEHPTRNIVRSMALKFGLRHDEKARFDLGWEIYQRIANYHGDANHREKLRDLAAISREETRAAMSRLVAAVAGTPSQAMGARHVRREPVKGMRYVVFSDHHYAYAGHRTSFFTSTMNLGVYVEALKHYLAAGYVLVENGDVEDLVIFDPTYSTDEVRIRATMTLSELQARRRVQRLVQLRHILRDPTNQMLFRVVAEFDADRRLIRLVGNHDYDLQRDEFLAELHRVYPNLECPADILLLERPISHERRPEVAFAILHGHQFDEATNPVVAPRIGETVSECLGLYFQGPDRNWRWDLDPVAEWATGHLPLANDLASKKGDLASVTATDLEATFSGTRHHRSFAEAYDALGDRFLEALMKHPIAFDYFWHRDPVACIRHEVMTGERFFKYQLLDEESLTSALADAFPDPGSRPVLLLGHTHEARFAPWSPTLRAPFTHYLNASSVGRFENLVWGIEIVDGHPSLVSWSRTPVLEGGVERRVWSATAAVAGGLLRANPAASPLPA